MLAFNLSRRKKVCLLDVYENFYPINDKQITITNENQLTSSYTLKRGVRLTCQTHPASVHAVRTQPLTDEDGDTITDSKIRITYPNGTSVEFSCFIPPDTCSYTFNDTWQLGTYNFTIWVKDETNTENESAVNHFYVNVSAEISLKTEKDT